DRRLRSDFASERQIGGPQAPTIRPHHGTPAVDGDNCPDYGAAGKSERGAANPALQAAGGGTQPRPGIAEREILGGDSCSLTAERTIGRLTGPCLPAGEAEVEQDRRGDDRHSRQADRKAAAGFEEPIHHTGGGVEPESRAARQHDRVDAIDKTAGASNSVSRPPGAPPRTSTEA